MKLLNTRGLGRTAPGCREYVLSVALSLSSIRWRRGSGRGGSPPPPTPLVTRGGREANIAAGASKNVPLKKAEDRLNRICRILAGRVHGHEPPPVFILSILSSCLHAFMPSPF